MKHILSLSLLLAACGGAPAREAQPIANSPDAGVVVAAPPDASTKCLDEVGCLLEAYPPACCSKYRRKTWRDGDPPPPPPAEIPDTLDSSEIRWSVSHVKDDILACGDQFPDAHGSVKLKVTVTPQGTVGSVVVRETPDPGLGDCAAAAMKRAAFARANNETHFSYPFNF